MTRTTPRRLTVVAVPALAALLLLTPPPARARTAENAGVTQAGLDERIDVALKDADPVQFFESFAEILGVDLEAPPDFESTLTMEVHNVRMATVLTVACESLGCLWRIEDGQMRIAEDLEAPERRGETPGLAGLAEGPSSAKLDEPIDMELEDADLRQVLQAFGAITGTAVEIDDALRGTVTVKLKSVPAREALDALCRTHRCRWELAETDAGPVLRVTPR